MEQLDPTFAWKQLYWSAIEEGLEPWAAAEQATRQLLGELKPRHQRSVDAPQLPAAA